MYTHANAQLWDMFGARAYQEHGGARGVLPVSASYSQVMPACRLLLYSLGSILRYYHVDMRVIDRPEDSAWWSSVYYCVGVLRTLELYIQPSTQQG